MTSVDAEPRASRRRTSEPSAAPDPDACPSPWHLVLIPLTFLLLVPLLWMVVTSLETAGGDAPVPTGARPARTRSWPTTPTPGSAAPFGTFMLNSVDRRVVVVDQQPGAVQHRRLRLRPGAVPRPGAAVRAC